MATYSVTINEKSQTGKNLLNLLKSMDVVKIKKTDTNTVDIDRADFLNDLKESVKQVKSNNTKPIEQLHNEA